MLNDNNTMLLIEGTEDSRMHQRQNPNIIENKRKKKAMNNNLYNLKRDEGS